MSNISVNCCTNCAKNLSYTDDYFKYRECTECRYLESIDARSIGKYNEWLKKK